MDRFSLGGSAIKSGADAEGGVIGGRKGGVLVDVLESYRRCNLINGGTSSTYRFVGDDAMMFPLPTRGIISISN